MISLTRRPRLAARILQHEGDPALLPLGAPLSLSKARFIPLLVLAERMRVHGAIHQGRVLLEALIGVVKWGPGDLRLLHGYRSTLTHSERYGCEPDSECKELAVERLACDDVISAALRIHYDDLYSRAMRHTRNHDDAEEIVARVYVAALAALRKGQDIGDMEAWLGAITNRELARFRAKQAKRRSKFLQVGTADEWGDVLPSSGAPNSMSEQDLQAEVDWPETKEQFGSAIREYVNGDLAEPVIAVLLEEQTPQEVAEDFGIDAARVRDAVWRARERIKKERTDLRRRLTN